MKALVVVDLQNDFMPETEHSDAGALAVKEANEVVGLANSLMMSGEFDVVVLTQDHHPPGHSSFVSSGKDGAMWPDHCVWNTSGAELHKDLAVSMANLILRKGTTHEVDSYSAFFDNDGTSVGLEGYLVNRGVNEVYIMGLATDYCVKFTVLDSVKCGFKTFLIQDGCRPVNLSPCDGEIAINEMLVAGAKVVDSTDLIGE